MYSSHPANGKFTRTQREAHRLQFEKIYRHLQFAHSEGKIYSHTARSTQREAHSEKHTARSTQLTILKNILACTVRTQRRKNLLAHSEKHAAYNFKKYTGMYSSHTAKEKFTRTQREAHSLQFEKIYWHVQFAHSEGKIYSHIAYNLKNIPACTVRTQ